MADRLLHRHNAGDWGELDDSDSVANDHAVRACEGRILSRYQMALELADPTDYDNAIWIITDDVADPDTVTTILWPSEY